MKAFLIRVLEDRAYGNRVLGKVGLYAALVYGLALALAMYLLH